MTRPAVATALAVACALALAACGGDDSDGGPRLSEAAYKQRGDSICASYTKRIGALGTPDQLNEIAPYIAKALPILSETVDRLGTLRPPKDLDDAFGRYLGAMRATRKRAVDLRNAAARGDGAAVQRLLAEAARSGSSTDDLARGAKLAVCAVT